MKGEQRRTKVFINNTYSSNPLTHAVSLTGARWADVDKTSPEFKEFFVHKIKNIPKCWKRAQERYIRHVNAASVMEPIFIKLFFKYFSPPGVIKVDRNLYWDWIREIHLDYGKWIIARKRGIDTDLMDVTDV
jgi:hypothetical protein